MLSNPDSFGRSPAQYRKETSSSVELDNLSLSTPLEYFFQLHYEDQAEAVKWAIKFRRVVFFLAVSHGLHDPEDFLCDVLLELSISESRRLYKPSQGAYFSYAWSVARYKAIKLLKLLKRRLDLDDSGDDDSLFPSIPDSTAIFEFRDLVNRLKPIYRDALILYFYEGLSDKEAALRLGISPAALRQRRKRALDELSPYIRV